MIQKSIRVITFAVIAVFLAACANLASNNPSNDPLIRPSGSKEDYDFKNWIDSQNWEENNEQGRDLIVLSFSGGGLRAATLAASVLDQLKDLGLDNKVAIISSTSGGSVTAGYYAATGEIDENFRKNFLYNNNTSELTSLLLPSLLVGADRSKKFASYLDEKLFQSNSRKYSELVKRWKDKTPFVILNASDASAGWTFEFTQESFSRLCSDLESFPISEAIAASAAFPFLMTPIPLRNNWDIEECRNSHPFDFESYQEAYNQRYTNLEKFLKARYSHSLRYTYGDDPSQEPYRKIKFLHLIDGGLSDNLAARALLRTFNSETLDLLRNKGVNRIMLIQVNARSDEERKIDTSGDVPSMIEIFKTVALNPVDLTTTLSSYLSREYWVQLVRYENNKDDESNSPQKRKLTFYPVQVDFDQMVTNSENQRKIKSIGTNWSLSSESINLIEKTGKDLLITHPCFKAFMAGSEPSSSGSSESYQCDTIKLSSQYSPATPVEAVAAMQYKEEIPVFDAPDMPAFEPLTLQAELLFGFGNDTLKEAGKEILNLEILEKMRAHPEVKLILITGHADRIGDDKYNQQLSERRAIAVKNYLAGQGIAIGRMHVVGKGEKEPVVECRGIHGKKLIECLQPNRRVVIEIESQRGN